jgi:predicted amidohydrolase YtcJ
MTTIEPRSHALWLAPTVAACNKQPVRRGLPLAALAWLAAWAWVATGVAQEPDLILHHGKIVTADANFTVAQAIAIDGERIVKVGTNDEVLALKGPGTKLVDLQGKCVLPGLIDSHTHPTSAALHEFDHPIPDMESIADVLEYIKSRAAVVPEGQWIVVRQVFITRLKEQRYPTRAELDAAAPRHPVVFSTGPDAMLNTLALKENGIDRDYRPTGAGVVEKDPTTGEPTGLVRALSIKTGTSGRSATPAQRRDRLAALFADYNSVGLTCVADRNASSSALEDYQQLCREGRLSVRMMISHGVNAGSRLETIRQQIAQIAAHPLRQPDPLLRIIGIKCFLDGGMLTGSAYMRAPWGVSDIYLIRDPQYRGVLMIEPEKLVEIVRAAAEAGLQFTAHSVGDGAIHTLLDAYAEVSRSMPLRATRPCITHCNFLTAEAIEQMAQLGVVADIQPAWLYLDARTLTAQFGRERLRYFQPLKTLAERGVIVGGGSDHMQKIGALRSINPYHPFLGMWVTLTRQARWFEGALNPQEALSRQQAIRFYTWNNAYLLFLEDQIGSLEAGKLADLIVLDRDLLTCPVDDVRQVRVLATYLGGRQVYP